MARGAPAAMVVGPSPDPGVPPTVTTRKPTALVLYASAHGHTLKVAQRIAGRLREAGLHAHLCEAGDPETPGPEGTDLVVAGGSVHGAHHQAALRDWLRRYATTLDLDRLGLFSVSLTAADAAEESRRRVDGYVEELLEDLPGRPVEVLAVAGALQYREYDVPTKVLMRLIAARQDRPTDWHVDTDYTEWEQVDAFADRLAGRIAISAPAV
jgi:menaquinone-dependent protoporphyrinogen oxidase